MAVVLGLPGARREADRVRLVRATTAAAVFIMALVVAVAVRVLLGLTQPGTLAAREAQDSPTRSQDQA